MARWLLKTEPTSYSFEDLAREKKTAWSGVKNPTALINLRAMKKGEQALIFHTGKERAIVGSATIASNPYADPKANDPKLVVVDVQVGKPLVHPITLAEIKKDLAFDGCDLLRLGRLSVVRIPENLWKRLGAMASNKARAEVRSAK